VIFLQLLMFYRNESKVFRNRLTNENDFSYVETKLFMGRSVQIPV